MKSLHDSHFESIDRRTTVLILGDARNTAAKRTPAS